MQLFCHRKVLHPISFRHFLTFSSCFAIQRCRIVFTFDPQKDQKSSTAASLKLRPGKVSENVHALTFQKANERAMAEAVSLLWFCLVMKASEASWTLAIASAPTPHPPPHSPPPPAPKWEGGPGLDSPSVLWLCMIFHDFLGFSGILPSVFLWFSKFFQYFSGFGWFWHEFLNNNNNNNNKEVETKAETP